MAVMYNAINRLLLLNLVISSCSAVLRGDEQYQGIDGGRFWAFHSDGVSIVNADTCEIDYPNIYTDYEGRPLPEKWLDGVYMESSDNNGYVFILSGVTKDEKTLHAKGEVLVMTTDPKYYDFGNGENPVRWRVPLDHTRMNNTLTNEEYWQHHAYGLHTLEEFWTVGSSQLFTLPLHKFTNKRNPQHVTAHHFGHSFNISSLAGQYKHNQQRYLDILLPGEEIPGEGDHFGNEDPPPTPPPTALPTPSVDPPPTPPPTALPTPSVDPPPTPLPTAFPTPSVDPPPTPPPTALSTTSDGTGGTGGDEQQGEGSNHHHHDHHAAAALIKAEIYHHATLLWDESEKLQNHAYVSVGLDHKIHIVDLYNKKLLGHYDYSGDIDSGDCKRHSWQSGVNPVHGMAYSDHNQHLYLECGTRGPLLEFSLKQPNKPKFITKHDGVSGDLQELNGFVIAIDRHDDQLQMLVPGENGEPSVIDHEISIPGHPDKASVYQNENGDTVLCMPLTENVNRNNIDRRTGEAVCDAYGCGPPTSKEDVDAGMCLWGNEDENPFHLLQIPFAHLEEVKKNVGLYDNTFCPRCKKESNYVTGVDGTKSCTCTPGCGSCATPDYDPSNTGVRCVSLKDVLSKKRQTKRNAKVNLIKGAGAVEQDVGGRECGYKYGGTRRSSTRGGKYQASIAHYPTNSLQIIDMSTQKLSCQVDLPGRPDRVVYVPPQPGQMESSLLVDNEGLKTGGKAILVIIGVLGSLIVSYLIWSQRRHGKHQREEIDSSATSPSSPPMKLHQADLVSVQLNSSSPYLEDHAESQLPEIS